MKAVCAGLDGEGDVRGVELHWQVVPEAVRYELKTWWDAGSGRRRVDGDNLTGTT